MPELNWVGKDKVVTHHLNVPYRILNHEYSFDLNGYHSEDIDAQNMVIHGDNLEALKSLMPRYEGRVNCIYIDPPYNTGNEQWVYNDNVNDPRIRKWLGEVVGVEGDDLSRHDKWLSMMYPRLRLLQRLLKVTGAIFISIDDNELHNLLSICYEIFGRKNHVTTFVWISEGHTDKSASITHNHEYILMFAKDISLLELNNVVDPNVPADSKIRRDFAENSIVKNGPKNPASYITLPPGFPSEIENGRWERFDRLEEFESRVKANNGIIHRSFKAEYSARYPLFDEDIEIEDGKTLNEVRAFSGWMNASKLRKFISDGYRPLDEGESTLRFYLSKTGAINYYRARSNNHFVQTTLRNFGTTETTKYELERMGVEFDFPKPIELLQYLISIVAGPDDIVLDSFAGSGTTGKAVLEANAEYGLNRSVILIELSDYAETKTAETLKKTICGYQDKDKVIPPKGGSFSYFELGETMFEEGSISLKVTLEDVREYIWYLETRQVLEVDSSPNPFYLGSFNHVVYYLAYEGIEPTTLDWDFLAQMDEDHPGDSYVIYADRCSLSQDELEEFNITFKKIPRDIESV